MNNMNDSLPGLMRRATEDLEPESNDLVERGIRRGVTLRRRRTAMLGLSGAAAVLATAGIIVGGTQVLGGNTQAPVAGTTTAKPSAPPAAAEPATAAGTLATLRGLLPENLQQSAPKSFDDGAGQYRAEVVLDDGKGESLLSLRIGTSKPITSCAGLDHCKVQPEGSVLRSFANESLKDPKRNPGGIKRTLVEIYRPDGRTISLQHFNTSLRSIQRTRPDTLLTVAQLTAIATSTEWVYPAAPPAVPRPPQQGDGKPTVALDQTLRTLKSVLPKNLQLTRPETWGGSEEGFNGASYVVNDGKGAAGVDVHLGYETPVTKCTGEGPQHCTVRGDGSVVGWSRNEPSYGDERQKINGVLANRVEIHYKDGRTIGMTSYNGPQEKDAMHTRALPMFSTSQLLAMAGNPGWKFTGTGTK